MNEIEEKFYKTFGIKPCKRGFTLKDCTDRDCSECGYFTAKITDRILLELSCIYSQRKRFILSKENYFSLKERLLKNLINYSNDNWIKVQVQSLFTEGEE